MLKFPHYTQTDFMNCGPTCLKIISSYYGKNYNLSDIVKISRTNREGSSLLDISNAAERLGFKTLGSKIKFQELTKDLVLPCIAHWNHYHFIVIYKITKDKIYVSDPAHGLIKYEKNEFLKYWAVNDAQEGIILLVEPTDNFHSELNEDVKKETKTNFSFLYNHIKSHKKLIAQLIIGLLTGSLLQLAFPLLTQSIVDIGINRKNLNFIHLILLAQLMIFLGRATIDIIRNYILLHISTRINISLVSDFFIKLMKLPISYFDVKMTGDIMQRINDNHQIESFLTGSSINSLFSLFNLTLFSGVLAWYSIEIFSIFLIGSTLYFMWIFFFLKRRAELNYKYFQQSSRNQSKMVELIYGMQEIKLHNAEKQKRWEWERLQAKIFDINLKGLSITTLQNSGSALINELKNIIITFLTAKMVLDDEVSLGMMLSISYIIGQLNGPITEMIGFIQNWQDAKLSLERLAEIHDKEEENTTNTKTSDTIGNCALEIKHLSFSYSERGGQQVLKNITCEIPANKITAIVGASGSGKTTLMKLLLKFYAPNEGEIQLNNTNLQNITPTSWRASCGVVMQEGYIFSDTIAQNIAIGSENIDSERLERAIEIANIKEFIDNLPLGKDTKIGGEGIGLSTGQKQRILIARAVYKDPNYLFFDEATSALDANNEKTIMKNLAGFYKNKTVVIIAHRLSTVKNADQILVLDNGQIVESGNHEDLTKLKGKYYELVKNQLELGN